jgi:2-hydroxy-3-keto-5-methylthiopentenyl-1-phosphate phosphatase
MRMFKHIKKKLDEANRELGTERGEAPDAKGTVQFTNDNGVSITVNSSDFVNIIRNNTQLKVRAFDIIEDDEIVSIEKH